VQEVLQADWQELWQVPQPPVFTVLERLPFITVLTCFFIKICLLDLPIIDHI